MNPNIIYNADQASSYSIILYIQKTYCGKAILGIEWLSCTDRLHKQLCSHPFSTQLHDYVERRNSYVKDSNDPNNSHLFGVNENSQTSFKNSFKNEHFAPNSNSPAFALFYMIKLHLPLIFKHRSQSKRILMTDSNLECLV